MMIFMQKSIKFCTPRLKTRQPVLPYLQPKLCNFGMKNAFQMHVQNVGNENFQTDMHIWNPMERFLVGLCTQFLRNSSNICTKGPFIYYASTFLGLWDPPPPLHKHVF